MGENKKINGQCLCGSVSFSAETKDNSLGACHCTMCRGWGGGPFLSVDCGSEIRFTGEEFIQRYTSSDWAERGFCSQCGTHLFYRFVQQDQYIVTAGVLQDQAHLNFDHQIFIDEKPDYYAFSNDTKNMTGPEVFAAFAADE